MDSILISIKKLLGIEEAYTEFDDEIIIFINSAFLNLLQLGVGPSSGFLISSKEELWSSFLSGSSNLDAVKLYVYFKVRLSFDPPSSSFVLEAIKNQLLEIEWRLNAQVEMGNLPGEGEEDFPIPGEIQESQSFWFDPEPWE